MRKWRRFSVIIGGDDAELQEAWERLSNALSGWTGYANDVRLEELPSNESATMPSGS